jgi:uncharacterized CHY-type Zn-finger protein
MFCDSRRMSEDLDRYITGNYGEDQFKNDTFYCGFCGKEFSIDEYELMGGICSNCGESLTEI